MITELVLNHTSDQHEWFQRARRAAPGSAWRNFYTWSDTTGKYKEARVIFKDVETSNWSWDPVARANYWHRFFSHQPDLNYESAEVQEAMIKVVDFWLGLGVDGLRLDAVPYLYEQEGTNCENLPKTHAFLRKLRAHVDENYADRMLLGEANQWPEDAVAYFGRGRGDECHMAFHFPLMPRLFMAVRMEDRTPIVDILEQTPSIPETSQWALFLRNHDELTLEMVTDEERDYMYRMYAHVHQARLNLGIRRRLAPLLGNDRKRLELLNGLLLSLPGTPVLYYGDEIGMGDNIYLGDRNGVRTPMQWSADRNAGFSRANPQQLYAPITLDPEYHYEAVNVEAQLRNPHSLLWWMRRVLALRKGWRALGEGGLDIVRGLPASGRRRAGLDAEWQEDFHHCLHVLLTGEQTGYYARFGGVAQFAGVWRAGKARRSFVVFSQNHDQVGNRPGGERLAALVPFEAQKLAAATVLLSPFVPLLFMGEEYGEKAPFRYFVGHSDPAVIRAVRKGRRAELAGWGWRGKEPDPQGQASFERSKLDGRLAERAPHRRLREFYRELIRLRRTLPLPTCADGGRMNVHAYRKERVLVVEYSKASRRSVLAFNYAGKMAEVGVALAAGRWRKRLDSASARWGGPGGEVPEEVRSRGGVKLRLPAKSVLVVESGALFRG